MATHDIVKGMMVAKGENLSFCEDYVEVKMSRQPFRSVGEICLVRKLQCVQEDTLSPLLMITQDVVGCTLLGVSQISLDNLSRV